MKELPEEQVSIENVVIMNETIETKWPLMVDPQNQALKFIKNLLSEEKVQVLKIQKLTGKVLEQCIFTGTPVIFEGVDDNIDPSVLPLIC